MGTRRRKEVKKARKTFWGVFETENFGLHVAPHDKHKKVKKPHRLDDQCPCQAKKDEQGITVHSIIQ